MNWTQNIVYDRTSAWFMIEEPNHQRETIMT